MSELTLLHVGSGAIGYGRLGVELRAGLDRAGVDVYDDLADPNEIASVAYQMVASGRRHKKTAAACWISVPTHARGWWEGTHLSIFTMWEATRLPESFRDNLHNFDMVFVPSQQNVELFSRYHDNVKYVPLGIDPTAWHYTPRTDPEAEFRFLIGGSGKRKGTDLAYRAYQTVFGKWWDGGIYTGPQPEPRLVMKNPKAENFHSPWVDLITGRISAEEEIDLYSQAHVYLQPSRGEGFGLQPLQALAQGLPTILTNAHGHASFAEFGIPLGWSYEPADYFIYGDAGDWWLPDFEELCEAMWDCYTNYEPQRKRAETHAHLIAHEWTWDVTTRKFLGHYGDVLDRPALSLDAGWVKPEYRQYLVRVNRYTECDIADLHRIFWPGKDYWEPADVKRILHESGRLDPSCLVAIDENGNMLDSGLTEKQLARLGDYTAARSYCPTCHQRLNTQPTQVDDLMAET